MSIENLMLKLNSLGKLKLSIDQTWELCNNNSTIEDAIALAAGSA